MIRALLCDLDDTLFDHAGATRDALAFLQTQDAAFRAWSLDTFDARHRVVLEALHQQVLAGRFSVEDARIERFRQLLADAGEAHADAARLHDLSWGYRGAYERAWRLVPGAAALLDAARHDGWRIAIVTNNVLREQQLKLERGELTARVDVLVTSEQFGASKPDPRLLWHALERLRIEPGAAVMFGDSLSTDIAGARAAAVPAVWFNRWEMESPDPRLCEVRALAPPADVLRVFETARTAVPRAS